MNTFGRSTRVPLLFTLLAIASLSPLSAAGPEIHAKIVPPASFAAGKKGSVVVEMTLGPKWHVNSNKPTETFLIPTQASLSASIGTLSAVRYPKHVLKRFSFSETPLAVYEGTVRFEADLDLPAAASGKVVLTGNLSYQACDENQCFPPKKLPLEASVPVEQAARKH